MDIDKETDLENMQDSSSPQVSSESTDETCSTESVTTTPSASESDDASSDSDNSDEASSGCDDSSATSDTETSTQDVPIAKKSGTGRAVAPCVRCIVARQHLCNRHVSGCNNCIRANKVCFYSSKIQPSTKDTKRSLYDDTTIRNYDVLNRVKKFTDKHYDTILELADSRSELYQPVCMQVYSPPILPFPHQRVTLFNYQELLQCMQYFASQVFEANRVPPKCFGIMDSSCLMASGN